MRRNKGFSILEVLIVVALVTILGTILAFGIRQIMFQARLSEAVSTVEREIGDARRFAKRLDRDIVVEIDELNGNWRVIVDGQPEQLSTDVAVTSGEASFTLSPPFGTYAGAPFSVDLDVRGNTATVIVTGVLAQTVVTR